MGGICSSSAHKDVANTHKPEEPKKEQKDDKEPAPTSILVGSPNNTSGRRKSLQDSQVQSTDIKKVRRHSTSKATSSSAHPETAAAPVHVQHHHKQSGIKIEKLALQFPTIAKSFTEVRKVFDSFHHDQKDLVTVDKLRAMLEKCGEERPITDQEVRDLFNLADLDGSKTISFREFLICMAMGYFLRSDIQSPRFLSIQKGFKVIEQAFKAMDEDQSGTVDVREFKQALFSAANSTNKEVLETRFRELDFNGDGDIRFPEFIYGLASWVGFGEDDGEEEEADDEAPAAAQAPAPAAETPTTAEAAAATAATPAVEAAASS